MQTAVLKLKQLGFSEYEAKAYMALVTESPLTAYELSKNAGIPSSKIYEVLRKLEFKHLIQSVYGERSKIFIPVPPDDFIQSFRSSVEDNLHAVSNELKTVRSELPTGYTWHIKTYESLIHRALRMINTARESLLMLLWKEEMSRVMDALGTAVERNVKLAIVHYGITDLKIQQLYIHPIEGTLYEEKGVRGFTLVADSKEALSGKIDVGSTDALWSMQQGFVIIAEDYIRHDIYFLKTSQRFSPVMRKKFGERFEMLRDVFRDDAF